MTPTHLATTILRANPTSWRGQRRAARQALVAFFTAATPSTYPRLPAWVTEQLRRVP